MRANLRYRIFPVSIPCTNLEDVTFKFAPFQRAISACPVTDGRPESGTPIPPEEGVS
jgi:hypothetical protein